MSAPKKARPVGYAEIEQALFELDVGEAGRWIAARLQGVANPAVQEAVRPGRARGRAAAPGGAGGRPRPRLVQAGRRAGAP
jgi:hypothetical protein